MAIDDAEIPDSGRVDDADSTPVRKGEYTWAEYLGEHGASGAVEMLYREVEEGPPSSGDWDRVDVDPVEHLGFHPSEVEERLSDADGRARALSTAIGGVCDGDRVAKDVYTWDDYREEYHDGDAESFEPAEELGFPPENLEGLLANAGQRAEELDTVVDDRTVNVASELDEDEFFTTPQGETTIANRYDLEKAVPLAKKSHFQEEERYWVNKPYSFVIIFHSTKENEKKYYLVEPHRNELEDDLQEFLTGKLRTAIKYSEEGIVGERPDDRRQVIEDETYSLLERYDLYSRKTQAGSLDQIADRFGAEDGGMIARLLRLAGWSGPRISSLGNGGLDGIEARPEPVVLEEDAETLTQYQVEKLLYYLKRNFIGYERIDGIKHDINVEDISCDGYNSPVFVYHADYEQIITNVYHGETELDDFVVKLSQRSGKGISKRRPQVDATLPDGSRAQLTLGREVSDHGTNYTIRQFKDVPFTPIDLVNWNTFSLDEMAYLWLCIENHKSLIFAGGTASGKTTSLNAVSLFIPSNAKIVSIEDTREVELPQRNWIASVTRPSFSDDDTGDVDEFDLLEAALRQRPDYIVMGEIRGEEGRTLFQVMSTGHTTYTTFHADTVGEVLKRFTTDPINVSKTMFTALDLVSIQTSTRVEGNKVRRSKSITEINHYDAENDEINVQDVFQWQAETDEFLKMGSSNTLDEIKFDRGWDQSRLNREMFKRKAVLAYLIDRGLNTYTQVAATFQAFINDQETILALMANDGLEQSLEDLREMESVLIDIDPEKEEMVPRPDPDAEVSELAADILDRAEDELFPDYRGEDLGEVATALQEMEAAPDVTAEETADSVDAEQPVDDESASAESPVENAAESSIGTDDESPLETTPDDEAGRAESPGETATGESVAAVDPGELAELADDQADVGPDSSSGLSEVFQGGGIDASVDDDADVAGDEDAGGDQSEDDDSGDELDQWGFGEVTGGDEEDR